MKTITANLKTLYQSGEMWYWYIFSGISIVILSIIAGHVMEKADHGAIIMPILVIYLIGTAMGRLTADVWNKPFSFCMPGHVETSGKLMSLVGIVAAITACLVMKVFFPGMISWTIGALLALFSIYNMFYWLSVLAAIRFNRAVISIFVFVYVIFPHISNSGLLMPVMSILLEHPWISFLICSAATWMIYQTVNSRYLPRLVCSAPWFYIPKGMQTVKFKRYWFGRIGSNRISLTAWLTEYMNQFFSEQIESNAPSSIAALTYGQVYLTIGPWIRIWGRTLILGVFFLILYCLFAQMDAPIEPLLFGIGSLVGASNYLNSPRPDILLPQGRREHFFMGIIAVITATLGLITMAGALILLSKVFSLIMPTVFLMAKAYKYAPFQFRFLFIPAIILPAAGALLILFRKNQIISIISIMCMTIGLFLINMFIINNGGYIFNPANILIIILLMIISWGAHLAMLYYSTMKTSGFHPAPSFSSTKTSFSGSTGDKAA